MVCKIMGRIFSAGRDAGPKMLDNYQLVTNKLDSVAAR